MTAKPLPIKHVAELVADDLVKGGWRTPEAVTIRVATSLSQIRGRLASLGFSDAEAHEFILDAIIDDTRCFACGRAESEHEDNNYDAEGMCTRSIIEEDK